MKEVHKFQDDIPIKLELVEDYSKINPDGSYGKTLKATLPLWFIDSLNQIIKNQNILMRSGLLKSVLGLDKEAKDE